MSTNIPHVAQGHVIKGQQLPLKVCFARDRLGGPSGNAANAAVAAVEAAQAMQHYSSWEPKEFDKDAAQVEKSTDHSQVNGGASLQDNGGYQYDQESGKEAYSFHSLYFEVCDYVAFYCKRLLHFFRQSHSI